MPISISNQNHDGVGEAATLESWLTARVKGEGFHCLGVVKPESLSASPNNQWLQDFLAAGFHGGMSWLEANAEKRGDPLQLWPDVRSILMLGMNYGPEADPLAALHQTSHGAISVYAQGADYHDVMKRKLKAIARDLVTWQACELKVFVDTAPVMEKPLSALAGLGWQGKHTNLVSREFGSWLFLAAIFVNIDLAPSAPETDHCGNCQRCLDICPTQAFIGPYRMDARRCISYLTIEHKEQIPLEFRHAMGNRIYGCDDCLAVCPWNKFAKAGEEVKFAARESAANPPLRALLALDDAAFRARFAGSPIKRIGRDRFIRNCLVAAGNSGDIEVMPLVKTLLNDASPLVAEMAAWAMGEFLARGQMDA